MSAQTLRAALAVPQDHGAQGFFHHLGLAVGVGKGSSLLFEEGLFELSVEGRVGEVRLGHEGEESGQIVEFLHSEDDLLIVGTFGVIFGQFDLMLAFGGLRNCGRLLEGRSYSFGFSEYFTAALLLISQQKVSDDLLFDHSTVYLADMHDVGYMFDILLVLILAARERRKEVLVLTFIPSHFAPL